VRVVEASEAEAREAAQKQQRMHAQMQLTCENLRRQLNSRTELLSHIAVTHQIAVAGLGKDDEDDEVLGRGSTITRARGDETGGGGRSLTLTDIRRNQQKVERRYGSFVLSGDETALRHRYDETEMMVQDQSLVPADLRDIGRDVPSRPATVLGTRQGATEQQQQQQVRRDARERPQPSKLDMFRSCSDVEAAAVDLEADIPPGLDDDAVES
jgi:hypothetical protein